MTNIRIIEKPVDVSYDEIHNLLWIANAMNRKNGFVLKTSTESGNELAKRVGKNGKTFIAITEGKIIGTLSVRFINRNRWYAKGEIADFLLIAIHPDFQGKHILRQLINEGIRFVNDQKCTIVELDTAEYNKRAIKAYQHFGFKLVSFKTVFGGDHHSVIMAKWISGCRFSNGEIWLRYNIKKWITKLLYKPGMIKRFKI